VRRADEGRQPAIGRRRKEELKMNNGGYAKGRRARTGCSLIAIALAVGAPAGAIAAQRIVLGEEFMATW
jgi:hypothetical protein